ncbi:hypothetical protein HHK36_006996 [Tetracentron sinense]|uniref:NAC domain-containing protein n=1 Tax=Tetracentron sinense TaxID=13715 RepID=A0A834ZIH3_TETSI|nr:hypothetical protein HHK36_006996 [Tetracentron sinense]
MVLYMSMVKGGKSEKTNWVMHQYHLGTKEDEKDGEFLISKIFYQKQAKQSDRIEQDLLLDIMNSVIANVGPVTPKSVIPEPPRTERQNSDIEAGQEPALYCMDPSTQVKNISSTLQKIYGINVEFLKNPKERYVEDGLQSERGNLNDQDHHKVEDHNNCMVDNNDNSAGEDTKWWEEESQFLLDSQQFVEGLALCDEFLQSQSSNGDGDGDGDGKEKKSQPRLSDYAHIGVEGLKKDLEECQNLDILDPANIDLGTPSDFRLSQLEFGSQDSFISWGGKVGD